jgi:hypothetical protein
MAAAVGWVKAQQLGRARAPLTGADREAEFRKLEALRGESR